jgi:tetratricopeptide (TPR) repeat protein
MRRGEIVDRRFAIERLAGSGGMGAVYRALDVETGAPVALKVLVGTPRQEDELRFEREALVLAEIDHPGIVRYVAHGRTAEGRPYLAMEWIEGEDLAARIARGPLSVAETIAMGISVAEALGAAHARGVVHRDLKPSNVLLAGGALDRAKIVDFGVATFPAAVRATSSGVVIGTPAYMAPEQARASRDHDARADVFALGCILHECLTGRPAFDGRHVMAVLAKIIFDEVPRLCDLGRDVPAGLDALIARLLAKDPAERPADGGAVAVLLMSLDAAMALATEERARVSIESGSLTRAEQRIVCMVLAKATPGEVDPDAVTVDPPDSRAVPAPAALAALEGRGFRVEVLADGTIAVTPGATGLASDQAALAAGCALALRATLPDWAVAIATGRAEVAGARPAGDAIERAGQRIGKRLRAGGPVTIDLDDVTAGLLDLRFDVAAGPLGLELRGEHEVAERTRTLLGRPTPFVGRDRELTTLEALFAECVEEPAARAALVTGPAGVGKSRLRHELMTRLRARGGVEVWIARGDPMRMGASFGLLAPLLRHAARLRDGEPVEERRQKLLARVARHVAAPERLRVAEFLGELVGTPFPDEGRVQLRAARQDPRLLGDQMRRAWIDLLDAETRAGPLVIVLEDLHWGDAPSEELTDTALRVLRERPLLVLGFARPEIHERHPGLWQQRAVQEIRLPELSRRACDRLARDVLGDGVVPETVAQLWERSGGNAFFLEELLRATVEGRGAHPETMLAMVASRLESLDAEDRRLLRAASVFGEIFWRGGVAALLGGDAALDERLAQLENEEWIARRTAQSFRGEVEYAFRHAIVREGTYGMLTAEDRALGHRLAAAWLERAGETDAVVLAEHHALGGERERAAAWYTVAAEQSLEANDLASVEARVERAVELGAAGEVLGRAALARARTLHWLGSHAEAGSWAERAAALLPEGSAAWAAATGCVVWAAGNRGDAARITSLARRLIQSIPGAELPASAVIELTHAMTWLVMIGRHDEAHSIEAEVAPIAERLRDQPEVDACWLAMRSTFASFDDPFAMHDLFEQAAARFADAGDARQACFRRVAVAEACVRLGAHEEAQRIAREAGEEAERMGLAPALRHAALCLALALGRGGALDEAIAVLETAIDAAAASNDLRMEGPSRLCLSEMLLCAGSLGAAEEEARAAIAKSAAFPPIQPCALATLADVLRAQGRIAEMLEHARRAYDLLERLGQVEEGEALVRVVYAEALHESGDHAAARAVIADARERLLSVAARAGDEARSRRFLEGVPENARTLALARRWLDEG